MSELKTATRNLPTELFFTLVGSLLFSWIANIFLPVQVGLVVGIAVFYPIVNLFFLFLEADSAIKRMGTKLIESFAFVIVFVGFRMLLGAVLHEPLGDVMADVEQESLSAFLAGPSFGKQLLFVIVSLYLTMLFSKKGKSRKRAGIVVAVMIGYLALGSYNQEFAFSVRNLANGLNQKTSHVARQIGQSFVVEAKMQFCRANQDIKISSAGINIPKGTKMVVVNDLLQKVGHEQMIKVSLPDRDGNYMTGEVLVPYRKVQFLDDFGRVAPESDIPSRLRSERRSMRTFTINLQPGKPYRIEGLPLRKGQKFVFPAFTGAFEHRVEDGANSCWEDVGNNRPWYALTSGILEIRSNSPVSVTVGIAKKS